jgi:hypothetical protein
MSPSRARFVVPYTHFASALLLLGACVGAALFLLDAPVWAYYLAPVLGIPFLIWANRLQDSAHVFEPPAHDDPPEPVDLDGSANRRTDMAASRSFDLP